MYIYIIWYICFLFIYLFIYVYLQHICTKPHFKVLVFWKFCPWHQPALFHAMPDSLTRKHNFEMENISPKKVLLLGQQVPFTKQNIAFWVAQRSPHEIPNSFTIPQYFEMGGLFSKEGVPLDTSSNFSMGYQTHPNIFPRKTNNWKWRSLSSREALLLRPSSIFPLKKICPLHHPALSPWNTRLFGQKTQLWNGKHFL